MIVKIGVIRSLQERTSGYPKWLCCDVLSLHPDTGRIAGIGAEEVNSEEFQSAVKTSAARSTKTSISGE